VQYLGAASCSVLHTHSDACLTDEPVIVRFCSSLLLQSLYLLCKDGLKLFRGLFVRSDPMSNGKRCTQPDFNIMNSQ
jgi:hypothetical protein